MSFLLDTNVISETIKTKPNTNVLAWFNQVTADDLYLSVLTLGEIRSGIEKSSHVKRKYRLTTWLEKELTAWFAERVLAITPTVADRWGFLTANNSTKPAIDSLIAATALTHGLKLVTRNVKDFTFPGLEVIDPWD